MAVASCLIAFILAAAPEELTRLSDMELLNQAEQAFSQGVLARQQPDQAQRFFQIAATAYDTLCARGVGNKDILRNQGHAYILAGDLCRAILALRRGLRLAPNDRHLQEDLTVAREQVVRADASALGRPPMDGRPPWLPRLAPSWLLVLALLSYSGFCVALTRWWMLRHSVWALLAVLTGSAALLMGISLAFDQATAEDARLHPLAVIGQDGVLLRKGNGLSYPPRYESPLHRGVEARVLFVRGSWLQIELAGGEVGWIPARAALVDVSLHSTARPLL